MTSFTLARTVSMLALAGLLALPRAAAAQSLTDLSLEDLMQIDAGQVFGASERLQPAMHDWFRRKGYLKAGDQLEITEFPRGTGND